MAYNTTAFANIQNNSAVPFTSVTLHHQYSNDPEEKMTWTNVAPGQTTPAMTVGYNTGFIRFGSDWWLVEYTLPDGSTWVTPSLVQDTLRADDAGTTKTFVITGSLVSTFNNTSWNVNLNVAPGYNGWAAIALVNDLPVAVNAKLTHAYSSDQPYTHQYPVLPANSTSALTDAFIVYYNTGFIRGGSDYWTISLALDIPPYDNAPNQAFAAFGNATPGIGCMLYASDNGLLHLFTVGGPGFGIGIKSGGKTDPWKTWNDYNTLAFFQFQNQFAGNVSSVTVGHRYSTDPEWEQTRGLIAPNGVSDWMVAEYLTGWNHPGFDYWNVTVYLEDGTFYKNGKDGKECYLTKVDAANPFKVVASSTTLTLGLQSGPCTDSMVNKGTFVPNAGRDPSKSYDDNAFIGSHNAFANFNEGFWYANQTSSLRTQMSLGATTLLLDIHYKDGEIILMHDYGVLQPFVQNQKLSVVLAGIREFLTMQARDPITIIFQDEVDALHQPLIRAAFEASNTWDMVFNPKTYGVGPKGWPTLAQFFTLKQPLIVLTSNRRSPDFAYQWDFMSENVYGDDSLNPLTWMNPRGQSKPLSQLALCALNHFPTWSVSNFTLPKALTAANRDNATSALQTMVDACKTKWARYPNYINADFWEIPDGGLVGAAVYMNRKLHGTTQEILRVQHGRAITADIDDGRHLIGDWERAAGWVDRHLDTICRAPDPESGEALVDQLEHAVNLALVLSCIRAANETDDRTIDAWLRRTAGRLAALLSGAEADVIARTEGNPGSREALVAIAFFAIERLTGVEFALTEWVRRNLLDGAIGADHDRLLLAGMAGRADAVGELRDRLNQTARAVGEGDRSASTLYDLTHEVLYLRLLGAAVAGDDVAAVIDAALVGIGSRDLAAEMLAAHWLAGGGANDQARAAARAVKDHAAALPSECERSDCDDCPCARFKDEVHERLTSLLALGATLGAAGELLEDLDQRVLIGA